MEENSMNADTAAIEQTKQTNPFWPFIPAGITWFIGLLFFAGSRSHFYLVDFDVRMVPIVLCDEAEISYCQKEMEYCKWFCRYFFADPSGHFLSFVCSDGTFYLRKITAQDSNL